MARIELDLDVPTEPRLVLSGSLSTYDDMQSLIRTARKLLADPRTERLEVDLDLVMELAPMAAGAVLALRVTAASTGKGIGFVNAHGDVREYLARERLLTWEG